MKETSKPVSTLIFVHIPTHFSEMMRVVELLARSGRYRPVVIFAAIYVGVERDIERSKPLGATVVTEPELQSYRQAAPVPQPHRLLSRMSLRPLQHSLHNVTNQIRHWGLSAAHWVDRRFGEIGAALQSAKQALPAGAQLIVTPYKDLGTAIRRVLVRWARTAKGVKRCAFSALRNAGCTVPTRHMSAGFARLSAARGVQTQIARPHTAAGAELKYRIFRFRPLARL